MVDEQDDDVTRICNSIDTLTGTLMDALAQVRSPLDAVFRVLDEDGHEFSCRPCESCRFITGVRGSPFGCVRLASERARREMQQALRSP